MKAVEHGVGATDLAHGALAVLDESGVREWIDGP